MKNNPQIRKKQFDRNNKRIYSANGGVTFLSVFHASNIQISKRNETRDRFIQRYYNDRSALSRIIPSLSYSLDDVYNPSDFISYTVSTILTRTAYYFGPSIQKVHCEYIIVEKFLRLR